MTKNYKNWQEITGNNQKLQDRSVEVRTRKETTGNERKQQETKENNRK